MIVTHEDRVPMLLQLETPPPGHVIRCVALAYPDITMSPKIHAGRHPVYRSHFGGDDDKWVVLASREGDIIIWETGSSQPRQIVKAPPSYGADHNPMTVYCPGDEGNEPVVLLYGHSDQEVIV